MLQYGEIITFSHLRWNFVYQRPQHLLSRMAVTRRVLYIEEPVYDTEAVPWWERDNPAPNVTTYRPHTPVRTRGFHADQIPYLKSLIEQLKDQAKLGNYILWLYTPMALPVTKTLCPMLTVFDCMDELSAFDDAAPELPEREAELLERANIVFTGGPSLYRAKRSRHQNVYCFSSSVDKAHFGRARGEAVEGPDQASLPRPRLGYFGVIDERVDHELIAAMAAAHPEWQIVLVGPVVKIDPAALPRRPDIHYFGQRRYEELPSFLAGWDVCLLPFARNEATRFISPTKTLEYMAAEKPIVSTPITDVAEPYGDIVYLGGTAAEFLDSCEHALASGEGERAERAEKMRRVLARTSWNATASAMEALIANELQSQAAKGRRPIRTRRASPVVVAGAGPAGLSAAYHLGGDALLLEQGDRVGGCCRSFYQNGFTFDWAGHIMFSQDAYVHQLYRLLLGENVHWQDREAWIYSKNVFTRYPFQGALYGLPPEVIKECIIGAIEARFGSLQERPNANAHARRGGTNGTAQLTDCCADGILEASVRLSEANLAEPSNFEEFIYRVWGAGIARHFAIPYNRKLWTVPLRDIETSWLGGRVPLPDLEDMIDGALRPLPKAMGPNARFGYPLYGGFQSLMNGFLPHLKSEVWLNAKVVAVSPSQQTLTLSDGRELSYEHLISTMPLPELVKAIGGEAPREVRRAAQALRHVSVRCVHIGIGRPNLTDKHWIYYPEDQVFHRIFVQGNASPNCNPPGGFGLTCEIAYSAHKPLPCDGAALIERCVADCRRVGLFGADDPIWASAQVDLPYAYVVCDHERTSNVKVISDWLSNYNVILAGRYSQWEYYNSDHAFLAGKKAAEQVGQKQSQPFHRTTATHVDAPA